MKWSCIPPAGNPIVLTRGLNELPSFEGYRSIWVNSGTAALAVALLVARRRSPNIRAPEVVLPGYGCPDLVAAARYAGVRPVLADVNIDDPGYNVESLRNALSLDTVAVVAVNFLGIRDRLEEIRHLISERPSIVLIEDNAQWFPELKADVQLIGDIVCLSFGRGKPVSLLGGGSLLLRDAFAKWLDSKWIAPVLPTTMVVLWWKIRAYNFLLRPECYGLVSRIPFLKLGRTQFKCLRSVEAMDSQRLVLLPDNLKRYLISSQEAAVAFRNVLPQHMDLSARLGARSGRLLRYPVLCDDVLQRDSLLGRLNRAGLGATAMYRAALPEVEGAQDCVVRDSLRASKKFAERVLTLPVHVGVNAAHVEKIKSIFQL